MALVDDVKKKVQRILTDDFGTIQIDRDGDFVVKFESAVTFVRLYELEKGDEVDVVVQAMCPLVIKVPLTNELYKWVATDGQGFTFGGCRLRPDDNGKTGSVEFDYSIVGNDLDPNELRSLVYRVAITANNLDNKLRDRFGGELFGPE